MNITDIEKLEGNPIHQTIQLIYTIFSSDFASLVLSLVWLGGMISWIRTDNPTSKKVVGWAVIIYSAGLITKFAIPDHATDWLSVVKSLVAMVTCAAVMLGFFVMVSANADREPPPDVDSDDELDETTSTGVEPTQLEDKPQPKNRKIIVD